MYRPTLVQAPPHRPIWKGNMTEDFNEKQRDDVRPSSRNSPSDRHGEERPPHPARPRLNRETVDRAWESGARRDHADYHPRNNNGQPPRNNWQRNQYSDRPSAQNGRRPYSNQQDNYRHPERPTNGNYNPRPERPTNGNYNPRPQSFGPPNRRFDDKRFDDRRSSPPRQGGYSPRPGSSFRDNQQHRDQQPQFPDRNQSRGYQRRDFDHGNNSPRPFERGNRFQQPDTQNPRWRSRPTEQNENDARRQHDPNRRERFEGDYERFETHETPRHLVNKTHQNSPRKGTDERHGTRPSDGHLLKGPRPAQRKKAQFRTEIAQDTEALIEQVDATTPVKDAAAPTVNDTPKAPRKPRVHTDDTATPGKKPKAKQGTPKSPSTGSKPSKRGFKWPTS